MSLLDWTRSETISKPSSIEVGWKPLAGGNPKTVSLQSTDVSTSISEYQTFQYTDASGASQSTDMVVYKEDIRKTTRARVNTEYVSELLRHGLGLPSGDDLERSVTTYEYRQTTDGPKLISECTTIYISGISLAGQLQNVLYSWSDPDNPSDYLFYDPPNSEFVSHETLVEYDEAKGADGRDYTRTRTSRWISAATLPEMKKSFAGYMKALSDRGTASAEAIDDALLAHSGLFFEGTEVSINIGRAPSPSKPSDADLARNEATNGTRIPPGATPTEVFGNDNGWTKYVPEQGSTAGQSSDWQDYNKDSNGDGVPDWAPLVPDDAQDYNVDSNTDGVPDWADYVPPVVDWQDFNQDSNTDGAPDWEAYVPPAVDWQDLNQDTNNDNVPDWATYVPPAVDWQDVNTDTNNDGVPDWAPFVPPAVDWQDVNVDTNNDGTPDWAVFVPPGQDWQDYVTDPDDPINTAIDTNADGIPDWADNLPTGQWQDYVTDPNDPLNTAIDTNNDGKPDWADNLPTGNWQDYVTDPVEWKDTAIDTNNDGRPDWADTLPPGKWEDLNKDTNGNGVPDWAAYIPPAVDWQDVNKDTNGDGTPDWALYVPPAVKWEDVNKDSNNDGTPDWAQYVPPAVDWQDVNVDTNSDGIPDWAQYVPPGQDWEDYVTNVSDPLNTAIDTNNDGIPDWAENLPTGNWQDYVTDANDPLNTAIDSNNDGIPDWAENLPTGQWQDYVVDPINWQNTAIDSDNDGIPDWAENLPTGQWQDYVLDPGDPLNTAIDSNNDGIPDWAQYTPPAVNWETFNVDTNNDGTPDWAAYVPPGKSWQDYVADINDPLNTAIDSNNDGIPDWASNLPSGRWQDYVTDINDPINTAIDSNGDGIPDWASNLPAGDWKDYVTDPTDWQNTAIDSNGDGIPDWADNTPIGWQEFNSDTTYTNPEPEVSNDKTITGRVIFDDQSYNDGSATVTATYDMPFAPDDYFYYEKGIRKLYRSGASAAAEKFGRLEAALDIGHAYGQNIVTSFDLTPTPDLAPVYIRLAGIEGAFLLDAPSYAWGPEGMVVSSDLLLIGVTGYDGISAPATSWLRLPVPPGSIGPAGVTTVEASPVKANSINIPSGFDVRNLAPVFAALPTNGVDVFREWRNNTSLVPPLLVLERETIAAGPTLGVVEFEYGLNTGTDTAVLATGPAVEFVWLTQVTPPAAAVAVAALAPAVAGGASVAVPAAAVNMVALAPTVVGGASVAVPAAGVAVAGVAPDLVGRQRTQVLVPAAGVSVAGLAPMVAGGASVAVPAVDLTVAGVAPAIQMVVKDPSFSSVQLLLHMDGSNGSTTFTDSSSAARAITVFGNAQISTAQSKFGGASALFDGNNDYLRATASAGLQFDGNFTIELWVYPLGTSDYIIGSSGTDSNTQVFRLNEGASGRLSFYLNGTQVFSPTAAGITANTWQHLAIARSGSSTRMFVNGSQIGSTNTTWTGTFRMDVIGTFFFNGTRSGNDVNGYIDDLRITKGVARYTSNFTPPTAPFPNA